MNDQTQFPFSNQNIVGNESLDVGQGIAVEASRPNRSMWQWMGAMGVGGAAVAIVAGIGFWLGSSRTEPASVAGLSGLPKELFASATHGGTNVVVSTGRISDEAEGVFFLDSTTGTLQCWVFYPRMQTFGAKFETNVTAQLQSGRNAEYLMVTGEMINMPTTNNFRPANCMVYVVDVKLGQFAAYTIPWVRAAEAAGQPQAGQFVFVGGGQFRNPTGGGGKKAAAPAAK